MQEATACSSCLSSTSASRLDPTRSNWSEPNLAWFGCMSRLMKVRMWERTRAWQQWKRTSLWGCYGLYWILYKQCKHTYKLLAVTYVALRKARKKDRPEGKGRHWEALLEHAARYAKSMESRKMVPWSWPWMTCFPFHPSRTKRIEWIVLCTSTEYSTKMYKDVQSTIRIPLQGHSNVSRKSQHCNCCNWTSKKELENIWELCNLRKNSNYSASRCVAASLRRCVASSSPSAELWRRPRAFLDGLHRPARSHANRRPEGISRAHLGGSPFYAFYILPRPRCVCLPEDVSASTLVKRKVDHPGTGHRWAPHSTAPYSAKHRIYCRIGNTRSCLTIILPENFAELDEGNGMFTWEFCRPKKAKISSTSSTAIQFAKPHCLHCTLRTLYTLYRSTHLRSAPPTAMCKLPKRLRRRIWQSRQWESVECINSP